MNIQDASRLACVPDQYTGVLSTYAKGLRTRERNKMKTTHRAPSPAALALIHQVAVHCCFFSANNLSCLHRDRNPRQFLHQQISDLCQLLRLCHRRQSLLLLLLLLYNSNNYNRHSHHSQKVLLVLIRLISSHYMWCTTRTTPARSACRTRTVCA